MACSLASRIALYEAEIDVTYINISLSSKKTETGDDYYSISPKGKVAALITANGNLLTENAAILTYIADVKPEKKLAPELTSKDRYKLIECLSYVGTELHKGFLFPMFASDSNNEIKEYAQMKLSQQLDYLSNQFAH